MNHGDHESHNSSDVAARVEHALNINCLAQSFWTRMLSNALEALYAESF
jgi:hypothetical protein